MVATTPTPPRERTRVLIIDDSAVVRQVLTSVLNSAPNLTVIGAASDPIFARERMNREWPDVIVLDLEMPRMDGITFLKQIMAVRPTPVVICSSLTERGASAAMEALSAGAVSVITKPRTKLKSFLEDEAAEFIRVVSSAAAGDPRRLKAASTAASEARRAAQGRSAEPAAHGLAETTDRIVAIGTSTGGTQALEVVLAALPRVDAGVVVVQHMPAQFTAAFATRLDQVCEADVAEAAEADRVLPGRVLIAPGGRHMQVVRDGAQYRVHVVDGEPVNRHKPSVDVLFDSVANCAGRNALGVIMTGMGDDGARGLLAMRRAGARTVGQDRSTCVVYGMPQAARDIGASQEEVPLTAIAPAIRSFAERREARR